MDAMIQPALRWALLMAGLLGRAALAQPAPTRLNYEAYVGGLNAVTLQASLALTPRDYRIEIAYRLKGVVGAMVSGDGTSVVEGRFQKDAPVPRTLASTGRYRGVERVTRIEWRDGTPQITAMVPAVEDEREPVPVQDQANTIDSLSAMASLLHQVAATGRCDGALTTFDGRRLSALQARTVGEEALAETGRSSFKGTALRCDFEGRQLAGFMRDGDQAALRRPLRGSAWFARIAPGEPLVPVRISFGVRTFGEATMYLVAGS